MSDLFHEEIPRGFVARVFRTIVACPQHTFQILTKRPEVMAEWSQWWNRPWPRNAWAGTSIESQLYADRARILRDVPAKIRFVSAEPLLGPLDLDLDGIHWLIVGGESGSHFWRGGHLRDRRFLVEKAAGRNFAPRPHATEWVRSLRDQALAVGTAFFFKQWGGPTPKAGGAELDGRTWQEYPAT